MKQDIYKTAQSIINSRLGIVKTAESNRSYSNETIADCIEMYIGEGISVEEISKQMSVGKPTIHRWINQHWFGNRISFNSNRSVFEIDIIVKKSDEK